MISEKNSQIDPYLCKMIQQEMITGSRRLSNYLWATLIFIGGTGFLLAGLSTYWQIELLPFTQVSDLLFFPQGIIMIFYGTAAISFSIFLWFMIILNIGGGYNRFDKINGLITIFRLGFPGKNRNISLTYCMKDVEAIRVNIKNGLNPKREIYLKIKDKREIPLTRVGQPLILTEIEDKAANLAKFLDVILERKQDY